MQLAPNNPSYYASLIVTQLPNWICPPSESSYPQGAVSFLSVAFEDPDGSKLKAILAEIPLLPR